MKSYLLVILATIILTSAAHFAIYNLKIGQKTSPSQAFLKMAKEQNGTLEIYPGLKVVYGVRELNFPRGHSLYMSHNWLGAVTKLDLSDRAQVYRTIGDQLEGFLSSHIDSFHRDAHVNFDAPSNLVLYYYSYRIDDVKGRIKVQIKNDHLVLYIFETNI